MYSTELVGKEDYTYDFILYNPDTKELLSFRFKDEANTHKRNFEKIGKFGFVVMTREDFENEFQNNKPGD